MKPPRQRNLQEIVLTARSKFAGIEISFSSALSKIIAGALGYSEKSILCSAELDDINPVYGIAEDGISILLRYNSRAIIPETDQNKVPIANAVEITKKSVEEFFSENGIEGLVEIADSLLKITFFYPSILLPKEIIKSEEKPQEDTKILEEEAPSEEVPAEMPSEDLEGVGMPPAKEDKL